MNKKMTIIGTSIAVILVGLLVTLKFLDNVKKYEEKEEAKGSGSKDVIAAADERKEQTKKIGGVEYDVGLTEQSTENDVMNTMHRMTHQKVVADDKWGVTPMIPSTINEVYDVVKVSSYRHKKELMEILTRWKKRDFDQIVNDHNYLWSQLGGTIGKAYGKLSKEDEALFIKNNFDQEIVKVWSDAYTYVQ